MESTAGLILVVNDNDVTRRFLKINLEMQGYQVEEADDGTTALEQIAVKAFDIVILDLKMPRMSGFEVLERLRSDGLLHYLPVIVVSASDDRADVIRCIETGAADYLSSPVDSTLLKCRVSAALGWRRLRENERDTLNCLNQLSRAVRALDSGNYNERDLEALVRRGDALGEVALLIQRLGREKQAHHGIGSRELEELKGELQEIQKTLQARSDANTTTTGRILVVEDEPASRKMLTLYLQQLGYQTETAEDGVIALEILAKRSFDTILLDVMMPRLDGFGVLQRIKEDPLLQHIPVIMISAVEETEDVVRLIDLGASDHLVKPYNRHFLGARVRACLMGKKLRDQELDYLRGVTTLSQAAAAIEAEEFEPSSLDELARRNDPVGRLGRVFQGMAREIVTRQKSLKRQVMQLRDELEDARQRTSTTQTDYAQTLDTGNLLESGAKIHVLASFRGGTGKSTVTANLGILLASAGLKVGMVDAALQSPGLHTLFGLSSRDAPGLHDVLFERTDLDKLTLDLSARLSFDGPGRLLLLPASNRISSLARLARQGYEPEKLTRVLESLVGELGLDVLLIDTQAGLNEELLLTLLLSTSATILVRPDSHDWEGTGALIQVAQKLKVKNLHLLLNQASASQKPEELRTKIGETFGLEVTGVLPLVQDMADGLYSLTHPEGAWTLALRELTVKLLQ